MLDILAITAPIFLLIGLGCAAVRSSYFAAGSLAALGQFVLRLALPTLLFRAVSQRTLAEVFELRFLAAFLIGSLVAMLAGLAVRAGAAARAWRPRRSSAWAPAAPTAPSSACRWRCK